MKQYLKTATLSICSILCFQSLQAQTKNIATGTFDKVIISPNIEVRLVEGTEEFVRIDNHSVPLDKINVKVKGQTLRIYLDDAKLVTKNVKNKGKNYKLSTPIYRNAVVSATISYKKMKKLSIRGEEEIVCESPIKREKFKVKMYGDAEFIASELEVENLKAVLFGENYFEVKNGFARIQKFRTFGENEINVRRLNNKLAVVRGYGENEFRVTTDNVIRFSSMGESSLTYQGNADLQKMIVLGDNSIVKR